MVSVSSTGPLPPIAAAAVGMVPPLTGGPPPLEAPLPPPPPLESESAPASSEGISAGVIAGGSILPPLLCACALLGVGLRRRRRLAALADEKRALEKLQEARRAPAHRESACEQRSPQHSTQRSPQRPTLSPQLPHSLSAAALSLSLRRAPADLGVAVRHALPASAPPNPRRGSPCLHRPTLPGLLDTARRPPRAPPSLSDARDGCGRGRRRGGQGRAAHGHRRARRHGRRAARHRGRDDAPRAQHAAASAGGRARGGVWPAPPRRASADRGAE
eukprot:4747915-Prymnesium_polylepis.1